MPPRRPYGCIPMRPFILIKGGEHLGVADIYAKIPYDLSGSMSKNRFRQELCWGISKWYTTIRKGCAGFRFS